MSYLSYLPFVNILLVIIICVLILISPSIAYKGAIQVAKLAIGPIQMDQMMPSVLPSI